MVYKLEFTYKRNKSKKAHNNDKMSSRIQYFKKRKIQFGVILFINLWNKSVSIGKTPSALLFQPYLRRVIKNKIILKTVFCGWFGFAVGEQKYNSKVKLRLMRRQLFKKKKIVVKTRFNQ